MTVTQINQKSKINEVTEKETIHVEYDVSDRASAGVGDGGADGGVRGRHRLEIW